jgi:DDE_Tnp_1-associated
MSSSPIAVLLPHAPTMSTPPVAVAAGEQPGLLAVLAAVPDPRDPRGVRYPLASVLAVAVCAVLAGAVTFAAIADWVRDLDAPAWARLGFIGRIPVASTVWRLLVRVDADALSTVLAGWLRARNPPASTTPAVVDRRWRRVIAVDGKVLRGSRLSDGSQVHLLSAYDTGTGVVLAQVRDCQTNGVTAVSCWSG